MRPDLACRIAVGGSPLQRAKGPETLTPQAFHQTRPYQTSVFAFTKRIVSFEKLFKVKMDNLHKRNENNANYNST